MKSSWTMFIRTATQAPPDDPFVRLLRERVANGCKVVRAHLLLTHDGARPEYLVVLDCKKQLSDLRIPHSAAFTRWSLEAGVRLAAPEEEARRFALLLTTSFEGIAREVGKDYFEAVLVARLLELGPPQVSALLAHQHVTRAHPGVHLERTLGAIDEALASNGRALVESLRYSTDEAASLLDDALCQSVDRLLHLTERRALFPPGED